MSDDGTKLLNPAGDCCCVVRDGEQVTEPQWRSSRLVLTDRRLVLVDAPDVDAFDWVPKPAGVLADNRR